MWAEELVRGNGKADFRDAGVQSEQGGGTGHELEQAG